MPKFILTGNTDPSDNTEAIRFESGENGAERCLVRGGDPLELSDNEVAIARGRGLVLAEVDNDGAPVEDSKPEAVKPAEQAPVTPSPSPASAASPSPTPPSSQAPAFPSGS